MDRSKKIAGTKQNQICNQIRGMPVDKPNPKTT